MFYMIQGVYGLSRDQDTRQTRELRYSIHIHVLNCTELYTLH